MFGRIMMILALMPILLGGCASFESQTGVLQASFDETTIAIDAPLPIVQASGTAIAGWSWFVIRDAMPDDAVVIDAALETGGSYRLDTGDKLRIFVYAQPSLSRIYTIDNEGFISIPLIGNIGARGLTTRGLEGSIRSRLGAQYVRDPHVTVDIQQNRPFFILGEVKSAGQFPYLSGLTVDAAVAIAGGYSERANERKVQITRRMNGEIVKLELPGDAEVRPGDTIHVKERWF